MCSNIPSTGWTNNFYQNNVDNYLYEKCSEYVSFISIVLIVDAHHFQRKDLISEFCWGIHYLLGVGMERKNKNFCKQRGKDSYVFGTALLVLLQRWQRIANYSEVTQTRSCSNSNRSDATASTSEATAKYWGHHYRRSASNQQTSRQTTAPAGVIFSPCYKKPFLHLNWALGGRNQR